MGRINELEFSRTSKEISLPRRGSEEAAGLDLALPYDIVLAPGDKTFVDTGVAFNIPEEHYMLIAPRSSNGDNKRADSSPLFEVKLALDNTIACIDSDYTGTIKLKITNLGNTTFIGYKGDYVVQAILQEYTKTDALVEVDTILKQTKRGDNGFGSSDTVKRT